MLLLAALPFGLSPTVDAAPRGNDPTATPARRAKRPPRQQEIRRLRPRTRTDRAPRAQPRLPQRAPNAEDDSFVGSFGTNVAGKSVELRADQLLDQNVAMLVVTGIVLPIPLRGKPYGINARHVHVLYPLGALPGTDLRVRCEGIFVVDVSVTVGPLTPDGDLVAFDDIVFKAKSGDDHRTTFQLIVETDELSKDDVLLISMDVPMKYEWMYGGAFSKCEIDQLD